MARFVLRYRGKGDSPPAARSKLHALGASILEDAGRTLLVEASEPELRAAFTSEYDWLIAPEVTYALPDPRQSIK